MDNEADFSARLRSLVMLRWRAALLGGLAFWMPDFLYHYFARSEPTTTAIWVLTVTMPSALVFVYCIGRDNNENKARSRAISMLLGIWFLGPTIIMLGQTFEGAGFRNVQPLFYWAVATVFPPLTLLMAGFDLSVFALLLASVSLALMYWLLEQRRKQPTLHN